VSRGDVCGGEKKKKGREGRGRVIGGGDGGAVVLAGLSKLGV
jgi:hypothetical protein